MISRRLLAGAAGATLAGACAAQAQSSPQTALTREALAQWLDRYGAAWTARDASAAALLFAEGATYHEMPFDAAMQGRAEIEAYWARVTEPQSNIRFSYDIIAIQGAQGVAHWHCAFDAGGALIELDGVFVLAFEAGGARVTSLREWWHVKAPA